MVFRRDGRFAAAFRALVILTLAIAEGGCWEGTKRETLATLLSVDGSVELSTDGGRTFSALQLSQHPGRSEILRTSSSARLALALLPNCLVQLDPDSSIEILRLGVVKNGNETGADMRERFAEIKLIRGRILVSHLWGEAIARLNIGTPHGETIVNSNTLFSLETNETRTRLVCATGSLGFRAQDASDTTRIKAGFIANSSGTTVNLGTAETDPAGQELVADALVIEQKLRDLAMRNRNVLPR